MVDTQGEAPQTRGRVIHWARFYDLASWLMSFGKAGSIRRAALELAGPEAGESVLDVGCGTGTLAIAAAAKVGPSGEVQGIDASPEMIEVARRKAEKQAPKSSFQPGLIETIPFPDDRFDLVLNTLMLHHLPDDLKRKGLAEMRRVLKPGGRLLVVDFASHGDSPIGHLLAILGHGGDGHGGHDLAEMMHEAGFAVEEAETKQRRLAFLLGRVEAA